MSVHQLIEHLKDYLRSEKFLKHLFRDILPHTSNLGGSKIYSFVKAQPKTFIDIKIIYLKRAYCDLAKKETTLIADMSFIYIATDNQTSDNQEDNEDIIDNVKLRAFGGIDCILSTVCPMIHECSTIRASSPEASHKLMHHLKETLETIRETLEIKRSQLL